MGLPQWRRRKVSRSGRESGARVASPGRPSRQRLQCRLAAGLRPSGRPQNVYRWGSHVLPNRTSRWFQSPIRGKITRSRQSLHLWAVGRATRLPRSGGRNYLAAHGSTRRVGAVAGGTRSSRGALDHGDELGQLPAQSLARKGVRPKRSRIYQIQGPSPKSRFPSALSDGHGRGWPASRGRAPKTRLGSGRTAGSRPGSPILPILSHLLPGRVEYRQARLCGRKNRLV